MRNATRVLTIITALLAGAVIGIHISWYAAPGTALAAYWYFNWLFKENGNG